MEEKSIFEVVVIATMSAGKSTVINALIGQELLHSANQATTATITRIHDKDGLPDFIGKAYSYQNELLFEQNVDADILKDWNANPQIKLIDLMGDIQGLHNDKAELVVYDTPGPNNSQDDNHEALTMQVIDDGHYGLILYVLNATQIGVHDDRSLLEKIKVALDKDSHKEIIFLLNKADCLDPEKGETLDKVVKNTQDYLLKIGFKNPIIIPTFAHYALIAQKVLRNIPLMRSERVVLTNLLESSSNQMMISSMMPNDLKLKVFNKLKNVKTSGKVKVNGMTIGKKQLEKAMFRTGFGVVQYVLQQKLSQSFYPFKSS